jgi:hypothetical protein
MDTIDENAQAAPQPSATFLFCAESGYLEGQTLLAIECLRKFGGRLANAPILVITPRFGPSLEVATLRRFDELGARYAYRNDRNDCSWYVYMNKASAALVAEEMVQTDQIIWLDSDVLVIDEPSTLLLGPAEDFACCSTDKNVGTSGPKDPNNNYWLALSEHYGVPLESLPWVEANHDKQRVRFRLHSGVYSFRTGTGLGREFSSDLMSMLTSGIGFSAKLPFPGDDVALAFSVIRLKLRWRQLVMSCNYEMTPASRVYSRDEVRGAKILHFHKALASRSGCDWFLGELETFRPDVAEWLRDRIPIPTKVGGLRRSIMRRLLYEFRRRRQRQIESLCSFSIHEERLAT